MRSSSVHEVFNQPPPLENYNLYEADRPLREALRREGGGWIEDEIRRYGALLGRRQTLRLGELANRHTPELRTHDRFGHRLDEVEYHPAWHELMRLGVEHALHARPWAEERAGAHVARGAMMMLRHQVDEGSSCPLTMTFAVLPSLRLEPELAQWWEPRVLSTKYDPRFLPPSEKRGVLFGMAMTERQGGSDVRANTTLAEPAGADGEYAITGHKWFCSAPMCDAFLVLAQAPAGLTCFLLPRFRPDASRNTFRIVRLKDKLGNRSNASSEVEFEGAFAQRIGEEGRGVVTILEMVRHTRFDCVLGSAATLRRAVAEATHHARHRAAFGELLAEQPLMRNVLADLCLESEASTALAMRLARGFDEARGDDAAASFTRLATPVAKYWVTKRAIAAVAEALECVGGNGYVEESPMARLLRDVPVNSLWEGAGNIQSLDVLRALARDPATVDAVVGELRAARGGDRHYDAFVQLLEAKLVADPGEVEARRLAEDLALALQGSLLVRQAPPAVADAFCAARLGAERALGVGALPAGCDFEAILERALAH